MVQTFQSDPAEKKLLFRQFWRGLLIEVIKEGPYRSLRFDSHLVQSRVLESQPGKLILNYAQHMIASLLFLPHPPKRILMIGLGGGSLARFFLDHFPDCHIDVVEYNEAIPPLAQDYFFLPKDPRLSIIIADGANYMATTQPKQGGYELILVDAFDHAGMSQSVYSGLFFKAAKGLMAEKGVMAVNMTRGEQLFFDRSVEILRGCFPDGLLRLPVNRTNNEIVLACRQAQAWGDWSRPKAQAEILSKQFDMDMGGFLDQIMPTGNTFWSRWSNRK
ncbi:MAG: spermidine synthase [Magnetococcales bacterium]|nr:spermidine synthase [Magnetococcales bacterium]